MIIAIPIALILMHKNGIQPMPLPNDLREFNHISREKIAREMPLTARMRVVPHNGGYLLISGIKQLNSIMAVYDDQTLVDVEMDCSSLLQRSPEP